MATQPTSQPWRKERGNGPPRPPEAPEPPENQSVTQQTRLAMFDCAAIKGSGGDGRVNMEQVEEEEAEAEAEAEAETTTRTRTPGFHEPSTSVQSAEQRCAAIRGYATQQIVVVEAKEKEKEKATSQQEDEVDDDVDGERNEKTGRTNRQPQVGEDPSQRRRETSRKAPDGHNVRDGVLDPLPSLKEQALKVRPRSGAIAAKLNALVKLENEGNTHMRKLTACYQLIAYLKQTIDPYVRKLRAASDALVKSEEVLSRMLADPNSRGCNNQHLQCCGVTHPSAPPPTAGRLDMESCVQREKAKWIEHKTTYDRLMSQYDKMMASIQLCERLRGLLSEWTEDAKKTHIKIRMQLLD